MASSDSSDESIGPLAGRVACILHNSSSSAADSDNSSLESVGISKINCTSFLAENHPNILDRVKTLYTEGRDKVYFSSSLMKDWGVKRRGSAHVLCDVCIVSCKRPVTLLTFVKENEDELLEYNTKVARYLVTSVREHLYCNFSLVAGVIGPTLFVSDKLFREEIRSLDEDVKLCSVPAWLHMNIVRCEQLVAFIDNMFVSCGSGLDSAFGITVPEQGETQNQLLMTGKASVRLPQDTQGDEQATDDDVVMSKLDNRRLVEMPTSTLENIELYMSQANGGKLQSIPSRSNGSSTDCRGLKLQVSQDSVFDEEAPWKIANTGRTDIPTGSSEEMFLRLGYELKASMERLEARMTRLETVFSEHKSSREKLRSSFPTSSIPGGKPDSPVFGMPRSEKNTVTPTGQKPLLSLDTKGDALKTHALGKFRKKQEYVNLRVSSESPRESDKEKNLTDQEKQRRQSDPQLLKPPATCNRYHSLG